MRSFTPFRPRFLMAALVLALLTACNGQPPPPTIPATVTTSGTAVIPSPTPPPTSPSTMPPPTPTATVPAAPTRGPEAILILAPGPGSRVVSPVTVSGMADPTFEQNLVIRIIDASGAELALMPTTIQSDIGQRGPYTIAVPFTVPADTQGFIQVYSTSARDGGTIHLSSVGVTLATSGAANIAPVTEQPEQIAIFQPVLGTVITGPTVTVSGEAIASFEQTLVVELLDENGTILAFTPITVAAPDLGQPGPFTATLTPPDGASGPARIVIRDPSPAHGGDSHVTSVEIQLAP